MWSSKRNPCCSAQSGGDANGRTRADSFLGADVSHTYRIKSALGRCALKISSMLRRHRLKLKPEYNSSRGLGCVGGHIRIQRVDAEDTRTAGDFTQPSGISATRVLHLSACMRVA